MEQLDLNMEDNEGVEETKEDMKLGKLQFSLDYDFQKGEVTYEACQCILYSISGVARMCCAAGIMLRRNYLCIKIHEIIQICLERQRH